MKIYFKGFILLFLAFQLTACGEMEIPDPIGPKPPTGVDFTININQSPYTSLKNVGGSALVTSEKIIIARLAVDNWAALSGYCPSDPSTALSYNSSNGTFTCSKDKSVFDYQGKVTSGTSSPLKAYKTTFSVNSGILRIYD